jgi:outer membrane protein OmpA-like peptidoglycan-associated protein
MNRILIAFMLGMLTIGTAFGQVLPHSPRTEDIINALHPENPPRTRSIRGVTLVPGQPTSKPSIDLKVNFAFDSADLETDSLQTLKRLGEALRDPRLAGFKFLIAGHTDARGSVEYNQALSERRAKAVRQHLIFYYDIPGERLAAMGYGKSRLLNSEHPEDAVNRRVQIVNEGQ